MAELNWDIEVENIDIEKELEGYVKKGFRWFPFLPGNVRMLCPNIDFAVDSIEFEEYFANTKLEFGNEEHINMIRAVEIMALLYKCNDDKRKYMDSNYFLRRTSLP